MLSSSIDGPIDPYRSIDKRSGEAIERQAGMTPIEILALLHCVAGCLDDGRIVWGSDVCDRDGVSAILVEQCTSDARNTGSTVSIQKLAEHYRLVDMRMSRSTNWSDSSQFMIGRFCQNIRLLQTGLSCLSVQLHRPGKKITVTLHHGSTGDLTVAHSQ
jgi:hypothetical protein